MKDKKSLIPKEVVNPIAIRIMEGREEKKETTSYGDTRYSDGNHTDWAQKK
jgi:hypothetical protein